MSPVVIVVIVIAVVLAVLFVGGLIVSGRRLQSSSWQEHVEAADQALERARAEDRGWDRVLLEEAARGALRQHKPDFGYDELMLVLVDDRPGVEQDHAHLMAVGQGAETRVVLARTAEGQWVVERVE
jgi:hypothetical protein